ncbi:cation efflux family-domain-containing protein [Pyrenochaeta sp. MPI-SDFR-AT-0127]|nr:cation efflux family-domain-containing protein [Pyrenochaeta sp. MPI-SDFR-AT-0127]
MLLRARRDGMSVFSQLRRVVHLSNGPPSPQALQTSGTLSRILRCARNPAIARSPLRVPQTQLRVLQTQANTKGLHHPPTAARPLNWSSTVHRIRHISPSAMTTQTQTRSHAGHSHHHHHHHDNTFLLSKNKNDAGVRITRIGLYVNLGMAVGKGVGGYVFNSQALTADAIHSLTDLVSDIMTLATVGWSLKPPSERFPSGYGKVESLGSLGVSGILLGGGFLMGWTALIALCQQFFPEAAAVAANWGLLPHSHGHHHGLDGMGPNINAAWLAGASILIKEWLYRATLKVATERKSTVLAANAYHHRVDSLTAFVALLLIAGSNVLNNAQWLDPVGGLVISLMVVQAGWGNTKNALLELADVGVDDEMKDNVRTAATKALESISTASAPVSVRAIQGVKAGQNYLMDIELGVPGTWTVEQTRGVENMIRERVGAKVRGVKKVRVRFVTDSASEPDFLDEFIPGDASATSSPESEAGHDHDHDHVHKHSEITDSNARRRK